MMKYKTMFHNLVRKIIIRLLRIYLQQYSYYPHLTANHLVFELVHILDTYTGMQADYYIERIDNTERRYRYVYSLHRWSKKLNPYKYIVIIDEGGLYMKRNVNKI